MSDYSENEIIEESSDTETEESSDTGSEDEVTEIIDDGEIEEDVSEPETEESDSADDTELEEDTSETEYEDDAGDTSDDEIEEDVSEPETEESDSADDTELEEDTSEAEYEDDASDTSDGEIEEDVSEPTAEEDEDDYRGIMGGIAKGATSVGSRMIGIDPVARDNISSAAGDWVKNYGYDAAKKMSETGFTQQGTEIPQKIFVPDEKGGHYEILADYDPNKDPQEGKDTFINPQLFGYKGSEIKAENGLESTSKYSQPNIANKYMESPFNNDYDALNKTTSQLIEEQKAKLDRIASEFDEAYPEKDNEFQEAYKKLEDLREREKDEKRRSEAGREAIKNAASLSKDKS